MCILPVLVSLFLVPVHVSMSSTNVASYFLNVSFHAVVYTAISFLHLTEFCHVDIYRHMQIYTDLGYEF